MLVGVPVFGLLLLILIQPPHGGGEKIPVTGDVARLADALSVM